VNRRLLILDNAIHRDIYKPFDHWARYVPPGVEVVRAVREDPPPRIDGFSHVLITGSEASILHDEPWMRVQADLVREASERGVPLLGSCHAHQMIARALGGPDCVRKAPEPEFGWIEIEILGDDPLFRGAVNPAWAFCSHFDEVVDLPPDFPVLARSSRCGIQAFRAGDVPVYGVQSHPEITPEEGERTLADFAPRFPAMNDHPVFRPARDTGLAHTLMENFFAME
jgi:GMP synthase (glutamine-hydrolysing)